MRVTWGETWLNEERISVYPKIFFALYLIIAAGWLAFSRDLIDPAGMPLGSDFITYWAASDLALSGRSIDAYDAAKIFAAERKAVPANTHLFFWAYPPTYHLVVLPLALMPYLLSFGVWILSTFALFVAYLRRLIPSRHTIWLLLAFPAGFSNIWYGQNGFLTTVLFAAAGLNLQRRPIVAGVLIGLLSFKPHLGLLLPFVLLAGRFWVPFVAASVTTLLVAALSMLVFGAENWVAFLESMPFVRENLESGNLPWDKMPTVFAAARLLGIAIPLAYALHLLAAATVALLTVHVWYRQLGTLHLRVALLAIALLLMSPYGFVYDLVLLALPIALLAADGLRHGWRPGMRTMLAVAYLSPPVLPAIAEKFSLQLMPLLLIAFYTFVYVRVVEAARQPRPVTAM